MDSSVPANNNPSPRWVVTPSRPPSRPPPPPPIFDPQSLGPGNGWDHSILSAALADATTPPSTSIGMNRSPFANAQSNSTQESSSRSSFHNPTQEAHIRSQLEDHYRNQHLLQGFSSPMPGTMNPPFFTNARNNNSFPRHSASDSFGVEDWDLGDPLNSNPFDRIFLPPPQSLISDGTELDNLSTNNSFAGDLRRPHVRTLDGVPLNNPYFGESTQNTNMVPGVMGARRYAPSNPPPRPSRQGAYLPAGMNTAPPRPPLPLSARPPVMSRSFALGFLNGDAAVRPHATIQANAPAGIPAGMGGPPALNASNLYDFSLPEGMDGSPLSDEDLACATEFRLFSFTPYGDLMIPIQQITRRHIAFARKALKFIRRNHTTIPAHPLQAQQTGTEAILKAILTIDVNSMATRDVVSALSIEDRRTAFRMLHNRVNAMYGTNDNLPFHRIAQDRHIELANKLSEGFLFHQSGAIVIGATEVGEAEEIRVELVETFKGIQLLLGKLERMSWAMDHGFEGDDAEEAELDVAVGRIQRAAGADMGRQRVGQVMEEFRERMMRPLSGRGGADDESMAGRLRGMLAARISRWDGMEMGMGGRGLDGRGLGDRGWGGRGLGEE